jgi:hypothetical protein
MLLPLGPGPASKGEGEMFDADRDFEQAIRERAYLIWEREGRPADRAEDHWRRASNDALRNSEVRVGELVEDEEKILFGRTDVNMPALLTKDVHGGVTDSHPLSIESLRQARRHDANAVEW